MFYEHLKGYESFWFGAWSQSFSCLLGQRGKLTLFGFWRTLRAGFLAFLRHCWWVVALALGINFVFLYGVNHTTTLYVRMAAHALGTALFVYLYNFLIVPWIVASVRCSMQRKDAAYFRSFWYLGLMAVVFAGIYAVVPSPLFLLISPLGLLIAVFNQGHSSFVNFVMPGVVFFTWYVCSMFFYADAQPKNIVVSTYHGLKMMLVNHPLFFVIQWPFLVLLYLVATYVHVYEAGNAYGLLLLYYIPVTCLFFVYICLIQVFYIQFRHTQKELYDA